MVQDTFGCALIKAATELGDLRFPGGEAVVAALLTASGKVLTSVWVQAAVDAACLCAETGAICEAHKLADKVVASACLQRISGPDPWRILPACGICQERLAYWGLGVLIAVPEGSAELGWAFRTLDELRPFYWGTANG